MKKVKNQTKYNNQIKKIKTINNMTVYVINSCHSRILMINLIINNLFNLKIMKIMIKITVSKVMLFKFRVKFDLVRFIN